MFIYLSNFSTSTYFILFQLVANATFQIFI